MSIEFSGSGDFRSDRSAGGLSTSAMGCWFYVSSATAGDNYYIISRSHASGGGHFWGVRLESGTSNVRIHYHHTSHLYACVTEALQAGWNFVVAGVNESANQQFLYINGTYVTDTESITGIDDTYIGLASNSRASSPYTYLTGRILFPTWFKSWPSEADCEAWYNDGVPIAPTEIYELVDHLTFYIPAKTTAAEISAEVGDEDLSLDDRGTGISTGDDPANVLWAASAPWIRKNNRLKSILGLAHSRKVDFVVIGDSTTLNDRAGSSLFGFSRGWEKQLHTWFGLYATGLVSANNYSDAANGPYDLRATAFYGYENQTDDDYTDGTIGDDGGCPGEGTFSIIEDKMQAGGDYSYISSDGTPGGAIESGILLDDSDGVFEGEDAYTYKAWFYKQTGIPAASPGCLMQVHDGTAEIGTQFVGTEDTDPAAIVSGEIEIPADAGRAGRDLRCRFQKPGEAITAPATFLYNRVFRSGASSGAALSLLRVRGGQSWDWIDDNLRGASMDSAVEEYLTALTEDQGSTKTVVFVYFMGYNDHGKTNRSQPDEMWDDMENHIDWLDARCAAAGIDDYYHIIQWALPHREEPDYAMVNLQRMLGRRLEDNRENVVSIDAAKEWSHGEIDGSPYDWLHDNIHPNDTGSMDFPEAIFDEANPTKGNLGRPVGRPREPRWRLKPS